MGPKVAAFEQIVAQRVGVQHAVAVNSGTSGLHVCVRALGMGDGDWVITTPFSFVASANVLLYERAVPVFVDVEPQTGNIDTDLVAEAAAGLTKGGRAAERWLPRRGVPQGGSLKGLLPVDVFGQPADFDPLSSRRSSTGCRSWRTRARRWAPSTRACRPAAWATRASSGSTPTSRSQRARAV